MGRRFFAAIHPPGLLALVAGLAGCGHPDAGTIKADPGQVEELRRGNSDRPAPTPTSRSKSAGNRPDYNDRSLKSRGGEGKP